MTPAARELGVGALESPRGALAVMAQAAELLTGCPDDDVAEEAARALAQAAADVAALVDAVAPIVAGLKAMITQDNAMSPQAVMTRRAVDALARVI